MSKYGDDEYIYNDNNKENKYFNASVLKTDNEFYKEEDNKKEKLINVKFHRFRNGNEDWEIYENNKNILILKGIGFTKIEKNYFKTVDGIKFIMDGYKSGWTTVVKFKQEIKKIIKKKKK